MTSLFSLQILFILCAYAHAKDFYSHVVKDSSGEDFPLETYRGKVTLVVNVASLCGYTDSTYRALKKLHDILSYGDFFSVLAFPCNQFGEQEPHDMPDILEYVKNEFDVEFPVFNKIKVIGEDADPAFKTLIVAVRHTLNSGFACYVNYLDNFMVPFLDLIGWGLKSAIPILT
ncbi:Glutathione peroxidase 7 [Halocaridina rubra]|uniref:Glutathione peroxidase n=1 Tax=Halocaridina rubra TaxID=373956 RepID=A0AAN8WGL6_HALRR